MKYPDIARKAGVEGRVIVTFVVNEVGNVVSPTITRGIGADLDLEAIRVLSETKFNPGRQDGKPVRVKMTLPIVFKLD